MGKAVRVDLSENVSRDRKQVRERAATWPWALEGKNAGGGTATGEVLTGPHLLFAGTVRKAKPSAEIVTDP